MAIKPRFKAEMADVYDRGAFVISPVEAARDFDRSTPARFVQQVDKETGLPVWTVLVMDADPEARKDDKVRTVKLLAERQPVSPAAVEVGGMELRPVEFDGLTVTPYLDDKRNRIAYSVRATGMRAPAKGGRPTGTEPKEPRIAA